MDQPDTENVPAPRRPVRKSEPPTTIDSAFDGVETVHVPEADGSGSDDGGVADHPAESPPPTIGIGGSTTHAALASGTRKLRITGGVAESSGSPGSDKFELGDELGRGGMAVVRVARDRYLHRELAIKTLPDLGDASARERFVEEAQITGQLQHPNIVPVHELGFYADGRPFIAMKRIVGRTFADAITEAWRNRRGQRLSQWPELRRLLDTLLRICDAVAFSHSQGVIHRDLKPHNVMVGEFGEVLVVDWGLAKPITRGGRDDDPDPDPEDVPTTTGSPSGARGRTRVISDRRAGKMDVTIHGTVSGTPAFMSPEQAGGLTGGLDEGTDIYALGAILYSVLTNHAPIEGGSIELQLQAAVGHRFPTPSKRVPRAGVPPELEAICEKAMARRRRDRYETVQQLRADIEAWLDDGLVSAASYGVLRRMAKWVRRHPTLTISSAMACVFLVLVTVGVVVWQSQVAAEKEKVAAEKANARQQELERLQAEKDKLEAEQTAMREMAEKAEWENLARHLGAAINRKRDEAILEFYRIWHDGKRRGLSDNRIYSEFTAEQGARYIAAFDRLVLAHQADPELVPVTADDWFHRGMLRYAIQRDHDGAILDFNRALETDPNDLESWIARAISLAALNRLDEALADLNRAIEIDPLHGNAWGNRGVVQIQLGNIEEAVRDLSRAIELEPDQPGHRVNRGMIRDRQGNLGAALEDYSAALQAQPDYVEALKKRANLYLKLRRYADARPDFERIVRITPDDWTCWLPLAGLREQAGDTAASIEALRTAYRLCPDPTYRQKMEATFRRLGVEPR